MSNVKEEIQKLKDELSRLNTLHDATIKNSGITPEEIEQARKDIESGNIPADIKDAFDASVAHAKRQGSERATHTQAQDKKQTANLSRRGALRL